MSLPSARPVLPKASEYTSLPWRATMTTAPGKRLLATSCFMVEEITARRSVDMPCDSGVALVKGCAQALGKASRAALATSAFRAKGGRD